MASEQLARARNPVTKEERDNILDYAAKALADMKTAQKHYAITEAVVEEPAVAEAVDEDITEIEDYTKLKHELSSIELSDEKTAVFTLGRYQPMGENHLYVIDTVIKIAETQSDSQAYVFITNTGGQDNKNLLVASEKLEIAESVVDGRNIQVEIKNMVEAAPYLMNEGYQNIILVIGCDRYKGFQKMLTKMIRPDINLFIVVLPRVGQNTPDCEFTTPFILHNSEKTELPSLAMVESERSIVGMSGTKIREEAREIKDYIDKIHKESRPLDQADAVAGLLTLQLYGRSKIPRKTLITLLKAMNPKRRERLLKIYNEHKKPKTTQANPR